MKNIECRRCGAILDADSGECPVCGAIYYVLSDDDASNAAAGMAAGKGSDLSDTRIFDEEISRFLEDEDVPRGDTEGIGRGSGHGDQRQPRTAPGEDYRQRPVRDRDDRYERQPARDRDDRYERQPARDRDDRYERQPVRSREDNHRQQVPERGDRYGRSEHSREQAGRRDGQQRQDSNRRGRTPYPEDDDYGEKKGIDKRIFLVGGIAAIAVLTFLICLMSGVFDFNKGTSTNYMPNVVGMDQDAARAMLEELEVRVETVAEDSDKPAGEVVRQSAKEGKLLTKNEVVMLSVSSGKTAEDEQESFAAPSFVGDTYEQALRAAVSKELIVVKDKEEYSAFPAGQIISQEPRSGTIVSRGDTIKVTLSLGPEPTAPPTPSPSPTPAGHLISVTAGKGGSISPRGMVSVAEGGSQSFVITPDAGYEIREVKVDGLNVGAVTSYTFTDVTNSHTIYAVFQLAAAPTPSPTPMPTATPVPTPSPTPEPTVAPTPSPTPEPTLPAMTEDGADGTENPA